MRLRGRGHPNIRGTHAKTLEFTADAELGQGGTCVVGVRATIVGTAPAAIAGPIRITLAAGGHEATVHAVANSRWRPGSPAVVRLSAVRLPNTLATDADLSSADLPRPLLSALADPGTELDIVIERDAREQPWLVRYAADQEHDDRLAAECAAADAILAEDAPARAVIAAHGGLLGDDAGDTLAGGGRVLAVSTSGRVSAPEPVRRLLARRPVVEVLGMSPELAVAAAAPDQAPILLGTELGARALAKLAATHRWARVVFRCPARDLPRLLDSLDAATATVLPLGASATDRPVWAPAARLRNAAGSADVLCALDPGEEFTGDADVELAPAALLESLLAAGVSAKTISTALAGQPGWSRRRSYDFVLGLNRAPKQD